MTYTHILHSLKVETFCSTAGILKFYHFQEDRKQWKYVSNPSVIECKRIVLCSVDKLKALDIIAMMSPH